MRRIPRLDWEKVADLFRPEGEFTGLVYPDAFVLVCDPDDRKFAALSAAAKRPLITNDKHLLADLNIIGIGALTPRAFLGEEADTLYGPQESPCSWGAGARASKEWFALVALNPAVIDRRSQIVS